MQAVGIRVMTMDEGDTEPRPIRGEAAAHTPGPWRVETLTDGRGLFIDSDHFGTVCRFPGDPPDTVLGKITGANANLIAAAPELLVKLKDAVNLLDYWGPSQDEFDNDEHEASWEKTMKEMIEIINKAEGRC